MGLQFFVWPIPLFSVLTLYTVGTTPRKEDQPTARSLNIHRTTKTTTLLLQFEPVTPVFERTKTVHAVDGVTAVICTTFINVPNYQFSQGIFLRSVSSSQWTTMLPRELQLADRSFLCSALKILPVTGTFNWEFINCFLWCISSALAFQLPKRPVH
jgi:hypothetical protein